MCGILFAENPSIDREHFIQSLLLMIHRGPDTNPNVCGIGNFKLGHTRLKILDLDNRSNQPFWSRDRRYVMVYNGEVYNFRELASKFGIEQSTTSDTEVIVELYALCGPRMLSYLNGMFAMVILDTKKNEIFVARDRLGVKPLYYSNTGGHFIVASEIAPIIQLIGNPKFDPIGVRQYRKLRTFFNGRTLYEEIKMFPGGHYMLNGRISRYWELDEPEKSFPEDEELYMLIKSAVDYRLLSDVSVGSYLSGGLDSTIVAALSGKPDTWTVGFPNYNEFEWARFAAERLGTSHTEVLIEKEEFLELALSMIRIRKEPLSVPNEVLLYKMTKAVKEKNTVILSGEGADELFFGYDRIFTWAATNSWNLEQFAQLYSYGTNSDLEVVEDAIAPFMIYGNSISILAAFFQIAHLHGLLRRLDNSTMLCSVEARVPFVDYRLVERMWGVPFQYRMRNGIVKYPLKKIFANIVPHKIIERSKIGFPVPLDEIPFRENMGTTPMDRWLIFNLSALGVDSGFTQQLEQQPSS